MKLQFAKMHGLGNDFVLFDGRVSPLHLSDEQLRFISDRRHGIGCDQILVIDPAIDQRADVAYRIYNSDGGEVEQCGNGVRCVARYLVDRDLAGARSVVAQTTNRTVEVSFEGDEQVRVNMSEPEFSPAAIPLVATHQQERYVLSMNGKETEIGAVSMGNPHAVIEVDDIRATPVGEFGPIVQADARFPNGVNVGFMEVIDSEHIRLRVYERGVGETRACGTGACAAVVIGRMWSRLGSRVDVELPGGHLQIEWLGDGAPVFMTGPISYVFEGTIEL
jgi:diaminopimelate epimerase